MLHTAPGPSAVPASPRKAVARRTPASSGRFTVIPLQSAEDLRPHVDAWDDLAREALEPNVFYESWFLLPAVRAFGAGQRLLFALVFEHLANTETPRLAGFFPLVQGRGYKGLPVRLLAAWHHPYSVLGAPLVRPGSASDVLATFLDWAGQPAQGCGLVNLPLFPGQGPVYQALIEHCRQEARLSHVDEIHGRALFLPRGDAAAYRAQALSGHHNREFRRQERGLAKLGRLEYRLLEQEEEVATWTEDFLRLEASGWKGKTGTAFACREADRDFLRAILAAARARGRLVMLGLFLDGRPIALKCNLRAGDGAFAFKIAFDETLAKYSPGVLLELFNIDYLHRHAAIRWMDSCAIAGHPMIDRLWLDRRLIMDVALSTGRRPGDAVVSLVPALRWLKRKLSFRRHGVQPENVSKTALSED
jgi:CelD/BcsL family acetyltransferase involved in cellulose biosynthesis